MWRELREGAHSAGSPEVEGDERSGLKPAKSFAAAVWAVAVADVSMSLDNVLAVAGAAREHPGILIVGLVFAVALMGVAAIIIAKDRKSVVSGRSVSVRVDSGGRRLINNKNHKNTLVNQGQQLTTYTEL